MKMSKKITLTHGLQALVDDDDDFDYLNQWKWYAETSYTRKDGTKLYYAYRWLSSMEQEKEDRRSKTMQQEIMGDLGSNEVVGFINHMVWI